MIGCFHLIGEACFFTSNDNFVLNMDLPSCAYVELGYDDNNVYTLPPHKR